MKRKNIIAFFTACIMICVFTSTALAAGYRMSWNGSSILGKRSIQSMRLSGNTTVKIFNNITRARGVPNRASATLSLQKQGAFGLWGTVYTMNQNKLGGQSWSITLESGTNSIWFSSNKINGMTNPLDMNGNIT